MQEHSRGAGGGTKKMYVEMQWLWPNKKGAQKSATFNVKSGCGVEAKKKRHTPPPTQKPKPPLLSQTMAAQEGRELQR